MMTINGEKPDRSAASLWRHFYHREADLENFAKAMLEFQQRFDWDFMKINPRASYHVEDWGNQLKWSTDELQKHRKTHFAVDEISDWDKIEPLPMTGPVLSGHLGAISKIKKSSDPELPLFMTVFCPLGIARYLCGSKEKLLEHLRKDTNKVMIC
jgi:uroporphyrinogen decarboxylase